MILEEEQNGKSRAGYGKEIINELSQKLSNEFGQGSSSTNLKQMRRFDTIFSKGQTVSDEFSSDYLDMPNWNIKISTSPFLMP